MPQRAASLLFHETVAGDVAAALASRGASQRELDHLLDRFTLTHLRDRYPLDLSAGDSLRFTVSSQMGGSGQIPITTTSGRYLLQVFHQ